MTIDTIRSSTLKAVAEQVAVEQDPQRLGQLMADINVLLDVIEKRAREIDEGGPQVEN